MPGPIIDMTPDGEFPRPAGTPLSTKILRIALMVAVVAAAFALAAFALWVALLLIPVFFVAATVAWLTWRWKLWQFRQRYSAATGKVSPVTARRPASASKL